MPEASRRCGGYRDEDPKVRGFAVDAAKTSDKLTSRVARDWEASNAHYSYRIVYGYYATTSLIRSELYYV